MHDNKQWLNKLIKINWKPQEIYSLFNKQSLWKQEVIQEKTGYCWLIATINCITAYVNRKYNIDNASFSILNLIIYDKYEKANTFLEQVYNTRKISLYDRKVIYILANAMTDRGNWNMAAELVKKYGLVPDETPETNQNIRTKELNALLSYVLKSYASVIREKYIESDYLEFREYKEQVLDNIYKIIVDYYTEPIKEIVIKKNIYNLKNEKISSKQFYNQYIDFPFDDYLCIMSNGYGANGFINEIQLDENIYKHSKQIILNVSEKEFIESIKKQIADNDTCWIGMDSGKFLFGDYGIYDDASFKISNILDDNYKENKKNIYDYKISIATHAVTLFDVDNVLNPKWWRVQNNINNKYINNANFYLSDSWFRKFVFIAVVKKKYLNVNLESFCVKKVMPWDLFRIS